MVRCGSEARWRTHTKKRSKVGINGSRDRGSLPSTVQENKGYGLVMKPAKHRKLEKLQLQAEECVTREEAQKIIRKADKAHRSWPRDDQDSFCSFAVIKFSHCKGPWSLCQFCCNRDRRRGMKPEMILAVFSNQWDFLPLRVACSWLPPCQQL